MLHLEVALFVLVAYLILSIYTYICTLVKEEFRLTYGRLGPTEFRLIVIIVNTLFIYTPWRHHTYVIGGQECGLFDIIGAAIAVIIFTMHIVQWLQDRRALSLKDPAKPYKPTK